MLPSSEGQATLRNPGGRWRPLLILGLAVFVGLSPLTLGYRLPDRDPEFATAGAIGVIDQIAQTPRPVGSPAHDAARRVIEDRLRASGLTPRTFTAFACRPVGRQASCARTINVLAVVPGRDSTGTVGLTAHYDSSLGSPGATDNGLGVGSLVEVARQLAAERRSESPAAPPANDVAFLFTDAEELGLLGAQAAVETGQFTPAVLVNVDARGTRGPALVHQFGPGSSRYVAALTASRLYATSVAAALTDLLPNDTDFDVFAERGTPGFNIAVIGGSARYEGPLDARAAIDAAAVEAVGSGTLRLTRALAGRDLRRPPGAGPAFATFSVGPLAVAVPTAALMPGAALALVALIGSVVVGRRAVPVRTVALATAVTLAGTVAAGALGWLIASVLGWLRPAWFGFVFGEPYSGGVAYAALAAVAVATAAVTCALWATTGRRGSLADGGLVLLAVAAVPVTVLAPPAAYVLVGPALLGGLARLGVSLAGRLESAGWIVRTVTATALVLLALPIAVLLFPTLGVPFAFAATTLLGLVAIVGLGDLVGRGPRRWPRLAPLAGLAVIVVVATAVAAIDPAPSSREPDQVSLTYRADRDTRTAIWLTPFPAGNSWVDAHVGDMTSPPDSPGLYAAAYRTGPADYRDLPRPVLGAVRRRAVGDSTAAQFRLTTQGDQIASVCLMADTLSRVSSVRVNAMPVASGPLSGAGPTGSWCVDVGGVNRGVDVTITYRGAGSVGAIVIGRTAGVPNLPSVPRQPDSVAAAAAAAIQTLVVQRVTL